MRKTALVPLILIGTFLMFGFNNCAKPNFSPIEKSNNTSTVGNPMTAVSSKLLSSTCAVIQRCHPQVSLTDCQDGLLPTPGFAAPLGLPASMDKMSSIFEAESSGSISGNESATGTCTSQIESLTCADSAVQNSYQPSSANPYASAPQMISAATCKQTFAPGVNLEVPIELIDVGLASRTTVALFERTRTSLNTNNYDGTVSYSFEVVARNADASSRNVNLVDANGAVKATVSVPGNTSNMTRIRSSFAATSGASQYRVQLAATPGAGQLEVFTGRILVQQTQATQTQIYIPLIGGYAGDANSADNKAAQIDKINFLNFDQNSNHYYGQWKKNNSAFDLIADDNPWTLEAVMSVGAAGDSVTAALFNASSGQAISASQISTSGLAPSLVSVSFADSSAQFSDLSTMELRAKKSATSSDGAIYRAGLWVKLTSLRHAEVPYRLAKTIWYNGSSSKSYVDGLSLMDLSAFTSPFQVSHEATGFLFGPSATCGSALANIGGQDGAAEYNLIGNVVAGSSLNFNSTTKALKRSASLILPNSPDRYVSRVIANPSSDSCVIPQSSIVVGF